MTLRWHAADQCIRMCCTPYSYAWVSIALLFVVLPTALCNGQAADTPDPQVAVSQKTTATDEEAAFRELTIAVAADLNSPVHSQSVEVVVEQAITSDRFNAPIQEAITTANEAEFNESQLLAAVMLMPASTIPRQEQISLLLDALVILSNQDSRFGLQLKVGMLNDGPRSSVLLNSIIAQLSRDPVILATELEARFKRGRQPSVVYSVVPLTNSNGSGLIPYVIQASKEDDRFIKSSTFISLKKTYTNAETASFALMKQRFRADTEVIFIRNDADQNLLLTPDEWSKMLVNPVAADVNEDSNISLDEYIDWFTRRKINQMRIAP